MAGRVPFRDGALLSRLAAGDDTAWDGIDRRHRPALRRYASSLARPGTVDPDDVVQDVLVRAHGELRGGFAPDHLSAWLHRMVRNATIDALRARARRPADALEDQPVADPDAGPDVLILRKERLRRTIDDVSRLPDAQRRALIARAVDDRPVREVARELGISEPAVAMTVLRARESLMRSAEARDADCDQIRPALHEAHGRRARPSERARLHLRDCPACREYRQDLRRLDRRLRGLTPPLLPLAGLLGGGAATAGVGAKSAVVVGAVALAVATGGAVVVEQHRTGPGGRSPGTIDAEFVGSSDVRRGGRLPAGTSVVSARVRIPAGVPPPGKIRSVTLTCPGAARVAEQLQLPGDSAFPRELRGPSPGGPGPGSGTGERSITMRFPSTRLRRSASFTTSVLCRRPDRDGSLVVDPRRTRRGETPAVSIAGFHYIHYRPGGAVVGTLMGHEPVSVRRLSKGGQWAQVVADVGERRGWVLKKYLRPR